MDTTYNFRAPQYVDFSTTVHDTEETDFFDYDLDTGAPVKAISPSPQSADETEPMTPYQDAESSHTIPQDSPITPSSPGDTMTLSPNDSPRSRRQANTRNQSIPRRSIFDGIELEMPQIKSHSMKTRLDRMTKTPRLDLRNRSVMKRMSQSPMTPEKVDEVKSVLHRDSRKRKHSEASNHDERPAKFISMAEHIIKLQKQTPARFHTKPRHDGVTKKTFGEKSCLKVTIPHTPALKSHLRSRPVHALTREQEELKNFEEAQKDKFKAMPLKENVFKPQKVAVVQKKPPTEIKPFKLTEYKPKQRATDAAPVVFKARPVPKTILNGPKVEVIPKKKVAAITPAAPKPSAMTCAPVKMPTTEIKPFSFDARVNYVKEKREKMIKEMERMDRKSRLFKARPLPSCVSSSEPRAKRPKQNEEEHPAPKFKARSPVVLRKAPFIPSKPAKTPLERKEFNLHSEARAKDRYKFDLLVKEKELQLEMLKRQEEEEEARREAEEIAKRRRETVHRAKPVPHYRLFEVQKSGAPLTDPHSPSFVQRLRERKPNVSNKLDTTFEVES